VCGKGLPAAEGPREGKPESGIPSVCSYSRAPRGDGGGSCSMWFLGWACGDGAACSQLDLITHVKRCLSKAQHSCMCDV
jgi:hypothetical protein